MCTRPSKVHITWSSSDASSYMSLPCLPSCNFQTPQHICQYIFSCFTYNKPPNRAKTATRMAPICTPPAPAKLDEPPMLPEAPALPVELGKIWWHVTLAGHTDGPWFAVHVVVWPVQVTLAGQTEAVWVPPGRTHVQVGRAEHGNGPELPVQVVVCPVPGNLGISIA